MGNHKDRLSVLEKVERGEISVEEAGTALQGVSTEVEDEEIQEEAEVEQEEASEQMVKKEETAEDSEENHIIKDVNAPTRRERKLALAETFQNWQPQMMVGLKNKGGSWEWPWKDKNWQWMWQNFGYPVYVSHSIDVKEGTELNIVSYQGDLFIRGWDGPMLKIYGAVFDVRIGHEDNVIRIASSTGQLQIWVPQGIARLKARIEPGDIWISNLSTDLDMYCQSGDLGCENIKGNVKARVNGGDIRLMGIDGSINANVIRGNSEVRNINSNDVILNATEGDIWLSLNAVNSGRFRCANDKGDINLLTNGELSCELLVEATKGGRISPIILPWQKLLERSESKLRGVLNGGGAYVSLITQSGRIYIQESWMGTASMPSIS